MLWTISFYLAVLSISLTERDELWRPGAGLFLSIGLGQLSIIFSEYELIIEILCCICVVLITKVWQNLLTLYYELEESRKW